jgi:hypothetical protein
MLAGFPFTTVMSLGVDCRVRFQLSRYFEARRAVPPADGSDLQAETRGPVLKGTNLFDWNICWFSSVIDCLESRFADLFLQENLQPLASDPNVVIDTRYDIRFFHLFHRAALPSFETMIAAQYAETSRKVTYLKTKLLDHLNAANPTLYIRCQGRESEAQDFCRAVRKTYPQHQFHLVLVDVRDATGGFVAHHDDYSIYRMTGQVNKPAAAAWSGDDAEWNALFGAIADVAALPAQPRY